MTLEVTSQVGLHGRTAEQVEVRRVQVVPEPRERDLRAAHTTTGDGIALQDERAPSGARKIDGGNEPVVAAADDDHVVTARVGIDAHANVTLIGGTQTVVAARDVAQASSRAVELGPARARPQPVHVARGPDPR